MDRDRTRVLGLGVTTVGLLIATVVVLDWFTFSLGALGGLGGDTVGIDLRSVHGCAGAGCQSVSLNTLRGMFPTLCKVTFFASIGYALLVAYQTFVRVAGGAVNDNLVRAGYYAGMLLFVLTGATAYLFQPEFPTGVGAALFGIELSIDRTWAPALSLLASLTGMFTMFYATQHDSGGVGEYRPITVAVPAARARIVEPVRQIIETASTRSVEDATREPVPTPSTDQPSAPSSVIPDVVRGKLRFAVVMAELTRAGIDARLESGSSILVLWRDVVGVVVRRLPDVYGGTAFVDIVSTTGSTLRILPWSRLAGDPVVDHASGSEMIDDGDPGSDARARAIVSHVIAHAPAAALDRATRTFLDEATARPLQLPDLDMLGEHDTRLA